MPIRVCKKCGNNLTISDNYFCSSCGDVLDAPLIKEPIISGKSVVYYDLNEKYLEFSKFFTKKVNPFLKVFPLKYLFVVLFSIFIVGGYNLYIHNSDYIYSVLTGKPLTTSDICNGDFICGEFGSDNIATLVPHDAAIYIEGFDFNKFSQLLLDFDPSFTYIFDELSAFNPSHFAVFAENIGSDVSWTMLIASSQEPTGNLLNMINNPQSISVGRLGNFYIISTKPSIVGDIQMVEAGLVKNISQNANYIIGKNISPKGQFLIVSSGNSSGIISQIQSNTRVPGYLKSLATQFLNKKSNYLVL